MNAFAISMKKWQCFYHLLNEKISSKCRYEIRDCHNYVCASKCVYKLAWAKPNRCSRSMKLYSTLTIVPAEDWEFGANELAGPVVGGWRGSSVEIFGLVLEKLNIEIFQGICQFIVFIANFQTDDLSYLPKYIS